MPDAYETANGLNPNNPADAGLDELGFGTDPLNPDTDGDGLTDGAEVIQGTDPLDPNSR